MSSPKGRTLRGFWRSWLMPGSLSLPFLLKNWNYGFPSYYFPSSDQAERQLKTDSRIWTIRSSSCEAARWPWIKRYCQSHCTHCAKPPFFVQKIQFPKFDFLQAKVLIWHEDSNYLICDFLVKIEFLDKS